MINLFHHINLFTDMLSHIVFRPPNPKDILAEDMSEYEQYREKILLTIFAVMLGFSFGTHYVISVIKKCIKFDYDIPKDKIMLIYVNGKKWFVINPTTHTNYYDILLLHLFKKGNPNSKVVNDRQRKSVKRLRMFLSILFWLILIWTFLFIMSASHKVDWNPFSYLHWE